MLRKIGHALYLLLLWAERLLAVKRGLDDESAETAIAKGDREAVNRDFKELLK